MDIPTNINLYLKKKLNNLFFRLSLFNIKYNLINI